MDFYYRPEIAVQVTDWVLYVTPVDGVQDLMRRRRSRPRGPTAATYEALSESTLLFPPEDPASANLYEYKAFTGAEFEAWAGLFADVTNV